ncbi:hypothetical protein WHT83_06200 [Aminobacter sp. P9b]|uniref:hypothetical protein n=1 Tax=Aminobacter sp. P9b TaxID=3133697 RepID=UPI003251AEBF
MTKYYVNAQGVYIGGFEGAAPPSGSIEVPTAPESATQPWLGDRWGPAPAPVIVLYPVDLWSRLTNAEADQVEAAMATQPVRVQNIFRSASSYRNDHELWPLLENVATGLFGAARAREILAAS